MIGGGRYDRLLQDARRGVGHSGCRRRDLDRPSSPSAERSHDGARAKLILASPSKGRLQENAAAFFARAGLELTQGRGARDYRGASPASKASRSRLSLRFRDRRAVWPWAKPISASPAKIWCARPSPTPTTKVELLAAARLWRRQCRRRRAAAWIDVRYMADLDDVAAAFRARHGRGCASRRNMSIDPALLRRAHGVSDYRIVESSGATEGAPAAGSGRSHRRHHDDRRDARGQCAEDPRRRRHSALAGQSRRLADGADWSDAAREAARIILSRIAAEEEARTTREVRASLPRSSEHILREAKANFGARIAQHGRWVSDVLLSGEKGRGARRLADRPRRQKRHQRAARLYLSGGERLVEQAGGAAWVIRMSFPAGRRPDRESRAAKPNPRSFWIPDHAHRACRE